MIGNAISCTFLWKAAEGCCFTGRLQAVAGCGHNCASCISSVHPGWCSSFFTCVELQLKWKLPVATFTQPQCSLKVWKNRKIVFSHMLPRVSEWMRVRRAVEMQPLPAAMWDCMEAVRPDPVGEEGWAVWLSCSQSVLSFSKGGWEKWGQGCGSVTGVKPVYAQEEPDCGTLPAQEFGETWLRRKILATGGEVSQAVAGEWSRGAVLSFAREFELRYKANVLNKRN